MTEVQTEIERINANVAETYSVLESAGAPAPAAYTTDNLAETARGISAVLYGAEQSLDDSQKAQARANVGAAPAYTYGTTDLTAGTSELATGTLYIVYE